MTVQLKKARTGPLLCRIISLFTTTQSQLSFRVCVYHYRAVVASLQRHCQSEDLDPVVRSASHFHRHIGTRRTATTAGSSW
jgi:hypothetical protein